MSLHKGDWLKILGGVALGATGLGLAGVGPLAGMLGASGAAGAGAGTAAGAGASTAASGGFAKLVAPTLINSGLSTTMSGAVGTPSVKMSQPVGVPSMGDNPDPFEVLRMIKSIKGGGLL